MESSFSAAPATDLSGLHVGSKVRHDRFGEGEIVSIEGEGGNAKATVAFDHFGQKQLLLKFAKLTMLNDWRLAYGMSGHATSRIVFRTAFRTTIYKYIRKDKKKRRGDVTSPFFPFKTHNSVHGWIQ